jgi:acyl carrier protein
MTIADASQARDAVEDRIPLSFNQRFLLTLDKGDDEGPFGPKYFFPSAWRLSGKVDVAALRGALADVVERHEILRTEVVREGDDGYQRILPPMAARLEVRDRPDAGAADADRVAEELLIEIEAGEYSFGDMPLLHGVLVRLADDTSILALIAHHAAVDTYSLQIIIRDVAASYAARTGHRPPELPAVRQYQEFTRWELDRGTGTEMAKAREYWHARLQDTTLHATRTDKLRSANVPKGTAAHRFLIDAGLTAEVMRLSKTLRCSPFMVMLAAYKVLLRDTTGETDLTVTTLSSGRGDARFQQTVGSFFNFVPLRTDLGPCGTFRDVVKATRTTCLEAYANEMPFPLVVAGTPQVMASLGDDGAMVAFQVFQEPFTVDRKVVGDIEYRDVRRRLTSQEETVDVPDGALWTLEIDPAGETLCSLLYNTNLFDHETMAAAADAYCQLLRRLVAEPDASLTTQGGGAVDTPIEQKVEEIWRTVLTVPDGQENATFFELNGDSMSAVRVVSRIQEEIGVVIDVADMFEQDPSLPVLVRNVRELATAA